MKFLLSIFLIFVFWSQIIFAVDRYYRKDWKHWIDADHNCINTRHEILKKRSLVPVTLSKNGCSVKTGEWDDYYYPEKMTKLSDIDIDHLVPLKHAHESGGKNWNKTQKEIFANDEENLVITNKKYNREKGSQTIATWLPVQKNYACKYLIDWMKIKKKYALTISSQEQKTFDLGIKNCNL